MAKLNLPKIVKPAAAQQAETREPEQYWANIGAYAVYENSNGEEERRFISLNYGIPLSGIADMKKGSSDEWNAMCSAKDSLRDQLLEIAQSLQPGQTEDIQITLQVRRVGERQEISPDVNPFMISLK